MKRTSGIYRLFNNRCMRNLIVLLGCLFSSQGWSALTVDITNGYNLVVDSNITSPSTYSPGAAYIGAKICNTGSTAVTNVFAYSGNYNGGVGSTPGVYPQKNTNSGTWPSYISGTGTYSLTHEGDGSGTADATRYVGTLEAGECRMQYWLISYPQCVNVDPDGSGPAGFEPDKPPCSKSITGDVKPNDDLSLNFDIWVKGDAVSTVSTTRSFTLRNEISSSANKIWPNTASKVPDEYLNAIQSVVGWGTLGPDGQPLTDRNPIYPGQRVITTQGIWYDLGNVGAGFDNDGDLSPDHNAWLQPVGDAAAFDPDCFRMVKTYGIVIVKLVGGGEMLIPFQDELYFTNLPDNTGVVGLVYYQFIATDQGCSAEMFPYQEAASGYDNEKFCSDFGLSLNLKSGVFPSDIITKTDGLNSTDPGTTSTYTITANNTTGVHLGAPDLGIPMMITDSIPQGTSYISGSPSITLPSGTGSFTQGYTDSSGNLDTCTINYSITGSSYTLLYSTDHGASWVTSEPVPASGVTDLRWILSTTIALDGTHNGTDCVSPNGTYDDGIQKTSLPAGKTTAASFQASVSSSAGPILMNTAKLGFGGSDSSTKAVDYTLVTGNNTISGSVFQDNGAGSYFANGVKDTGETGIGNGTSGVLVTLYFDVNGNGTYDTGDIRYGETVSASGTGAYSFTSLPDGPYLVVIKKYDGAVSDGVSNAVNDFSTGFGNTTKDPNLPLSTDQGIVKMTETSTQLTLAVNVDLDKNASTGQTVSNVDFSFAPPLKMTKLVQGNALSVDEGDVFDYKIILENRLPTVGRQGPTGCEYTVWASSGTTGSNPKDFSNPGNAYDASTPNRTVASAAVEGGANRWILGQTFNMPNLGSTVGITKVEALFYSYFSTKLDDDYLDIKAGLSSSTVDGNGLKTTYSSGTISTAQIESYTQEPKDIDPNSSISWNMTSNRPGGGSWTWNDFPGVKLQVNPGKVAGADGKIYYLDAIGLRVTTDCDCEASNSTTLSPVPLQDKFDPSKFTFVSADPPPDVVDTANGYIYWNDVGEITPGNTKTVTVTFKARDVDGTVTGNCPGDAGADTACNEVRTDYTRNSVSYRTFYADGRQANDDYSEVKLNIVGKAEIRGTVWSDANNDGWPNNDGESGLPNVMVSLYACVTSSTGAIYSGSQNNTYCSSGQGREWRKLAAAATDASGNYEFIGLDTGYYIVEVGDTNGAPGTGNTSPYSGTQTAEPNDNQTSSGGNATGTTGICSGGCNNTWGNPNAELYGESQINLLNRTTEETINGVNFAYYIPNAVIYGNIWHDINANTVQNPGETGTPGFTVELSNGSCTLGVNCLKTTTDVNGNYSFSGLGAGTYTIVVTPPTLPSAVWTETVECYTPPPPGAQTCDSTPSNLDDRLSVTLTAGQFSGPQNFGYTQKSVSKIGNTLYYDFNGNGSQDAGEAGIPNVTVYLYKDIDKDGTIDDGVDTVISSKTTDAAGQYLFENLPSGSYIVVVDTSDPDFPVNVTPTGDPDINSAIIGGKIWLDADRQGDKDSGEEGIPEVVVRLYEDSNGNGVLDAGDQIAAAVTTDLNGNYLFTRLNKGSYWVDIDETTLSGSGLILSSSDPINTKITISDRVSGSYLTADAGYKPSSGYALGNRVWSDADGDGVQDPGEAGIGGVDITVQLTSCYPNCPTKYSTVTDVSGFWMITGLANGNYTILVDSADLITRFSRTNPSTGGYTQTRTINNADDMTVDFGYRYDTDGNRLTRDAGDPTGYISGSVFQDKDGDRSLDAGESMSGVTVNLYDKYGNLVSTTASGSDGSYKFDGVLLGTYMVQAIDKSGTYTTTFLASGEGFSGVNLIFDPQRQTTVDSIAGVTVDGVYNDLTIDFGYQRFFGSIGDTIYHDANGNATQDFGELGVSGVTVELYLWNDADGDRIVDSGETVTYLQSTVTTANDPATPADESGKYLFTNLTMPPANQYYVVKVDTASLPGTAVLTADPDSDGTPCPQPPPSGSPCDSQHPVTGFNEGNNYLGADFGYKITAPGYAVIGDRVWLDSNANGDQDAGERGISFVKVNLHKDGVLIKQTTTDAEGYYFFSELADGTYVVSLDKTSWSSNLTAVYERDGSVNNSVTVVVSGGIITTIGGDTCGGTCSAQNLTIDFGYQYSFPNPKVLSGTICIDEMTSPNGYCGNTDTTYSGVDSDEWALSGLRVTFYEWIDTNANNRAWDNTTGALDSGDIFNFLGTATSNSNGDFSISNLPNKIIAIMSVPAASSLNLTTTNSATVEDAVSRQLYEGLSVYDGREVTVVARRALDLSGDADNTIYDLDFAFAGVFPSGVIGYDYGDLPSNYNATLAANGGAKHVVTSSSVYLGSGVSTESEGKISDTASLDDKDDGVSFTPSQNWNRNTNYTESVTVTASAPGKLIAWMDMNQDGDFTDPGEEIINRNVTTGTNTIPFTVNIPYTVSSGTQTFFTRFRIYPANTTFFASPKGVALDSSFKELSGEVEDYQWTNGITYALISDFRAYGLNHQVIVEWQTTGEVGTVGFYLERLNPASDKFKTVNKDILPALMTDQQGGVYRYLDDGVLPGGIYTYRLVEIDTDGRENLYGPFTVMADQTAPEGILSEYNRNPHRVSDETKKRLDLAKENRKTVKFNNRKRSGNHVKISLSKSGLYYLSAETIADLFGISLTTAVNAIQTNHISLMTMGRDAAYVPAKNNAGIYFYGEKLNSIYTNETVYWLKMDKGIQMSRIKAKQKKISAAPANQTFTWTSHAEVNQFPATGLSDPESDYWLWDYLYAGYAGLDVKSFAIHTPDRDPNADAELIIRLQGGNDTPVSPDHHAVIRLNGTEIGQQYVEGVQSAIVKIPISAWMLKNGENIVEIKAAKDTGAPVSMFYVDYFDLTYQRLFIAENNVLTFMSQGYPVITVSGFNRSDITVLDITDPKRPKTVEFQTEKVSGEYRITFEAENGSMYYAAGQDNVIVVSDAWVDLPSALASENNQADYLIIAPSELLEASKLLAAYRKSQGLETLVVDLEDIMDEFNGGVFTPWAINDFLTYAYYHWKKCPAYVLLVGSGTVDYKNYMMLGDNLMPVVLAPTPYGMFAADNRFADIVGNDSVPEMAIGRLPVLTPAELQALINKIIYYETIPEGNWSKQVMLIADNVDNGGDFPYNSDQLAKILPLPYQAQKLYILPKVPAKTVRAQILNGINAGVGFIHYTGHGGMDRLASEGLLISTDVPSMKNQLLPVMSFMTCQAGRFEYPGFESLAEKLVTKTGGGAASVWTASGLSDNYMAQILAHAYFQTTVIEGEKRIGKSVQKALRAFEKQKGSRFMLDIYNLLGDPAMLLK